MWGIRAMVMKLCGSAQIINDAFKLVWRMAGAPIELPPCSKIKTNGKASKSASKTEESPAAHPIVLGQSPPQPLRCPMSN